MMQSHNSLRVVLPLQVDRLYGWKSSPDCAVREAFKRQKDHVMKEFDDRSNQVFLQLNEQVRLSQMRPSYQDQHTGCVNRLTRHVEQRCSVALWLLSLQQVLY